MSFSPKSDCENFSGKQANVWLPACSRRPSGLGEVIGLAMGERHNSALVCRALNDAFNQCSDAQVTLVHSDQGVEYDSYQYRNILKDKT